MSSAKKSVIICLLVGVCCLPVQLSVAFDSRSNPARQAQDDRLYDQIYKVARWFDQYCSWNHRFPEVGDETADATQQLNDLVPNNPYDALDLGLTPGLDVDPNSPSYDDEESIPAAYSYSDVAAKNNRINLKLDPSLTELQIQEYQINPPLDWQAPPGTITAISNQQNLFVVWGANRRGLPLRDSASGRVIFVIGRYRLLY